MQKFGKRHNACPNSPVYQRFAQKLADQLAQRYAGNKHVVCWHVGNEYGGICYCENCEKAFRVWLRKKYKTLDALNKAWNSEFWGHTIYDWDEIVVPNALGDGIENEKTVFAGISIDYYRFNSDSLLSNFIAERDAIRSYDAKTPDHNKHDGALINSWITLSGPRKWISSPGIITRHTIRPGAWLPCIMI